MAKERYVVITPDYGFAAVRNKFEQEMLEKVFKIDPKAKYELKKIPYTIESKYLPDVVLSNGVLVEFKGYFRAADQRKIKAIKDSGHDIRMVFQDSTKLIRPRAKMNYGQWADKYGIPWSENEIPKEWVE